MHLNDTKLILNYQKGHSDSFRINLGSGATHKRRQNILGGEEGLKFQCCKKLEGRSLVNKGQNSDMGEGGIKDGQKNSDVFYGRLLVEFNASFACC